MATYKELQDIIIDRLKKNNLDVQVAAAINSTIQFYQQDHFWFNEDVQNISLISGQEKLDLPSNFLTEVENGGLTTIVSTSYYPVRKLNIMEFNILRNINSKARPCNFMVQNKGISLYPIPDQDYTLILYYIKSYDALVNDDDTNDWTENAARLIEAKTIEDVWFNQTKDVERWASFKQKTDEEYDKLKSFSNKRIASGKLITDDIVTHGDNIFGYSDQY